MPDVVQKFRNDRHYNPKNGGYITLRRTSYVTFQRRMFFHKENNMNNIQLSIYSIRLLNLLFQELENSFQFMIQNLIMSLINARS